MTKIQTITLIKAEINRLINSAQVNIFAMENDKNPQVKAMVIKNQGYKMALEDMREFMLNKHI